MVHLRAFAQAFEVLVDFPKLGNQRVISADRGLPFQGHDHQRLLSRGDMVFIERAYQAQTIHQGHQLAVVLDDPFHADFFEFAQLPFVNQHAFGELGHHLRF
ncbi:hypothetical protein D3C81_1673700 [compost metagenome]